MAPVPASIVDAHIHLWDQRKTPRRTTPLIRLFGWNESVLHAAARLIFPADLRDFFGLHSEVLHDYLSAHYRADMDSSGVAAYVHVQAGWEGRGKLGPVGETRWLAGLSDPPAAIVAHADLRQGEAVRALLEAHLEASPKVRSIRDMLSHHPDPRVHSFAAKAGLSEDSRWREGYAQLGRCGLAFDAWCYAHQLQEVLSLARAFPDIPIQLCHAGTPVAWASCAPGDPRRQRWAQAMKALSECPQVRVKLSGWGMPVLGWGWEQEGSRPTTETVVEAWRAPMEQTIEFFGPDRCMFASNFPVDRVSLDGETLWAAFREIAAQYSQGEQEALFAGCAQAAYSIG